MVYTKDSILRWMRRSALWIISISLLPLPMGGALASSIESELVLGIVSNKTTAIRPLAPVERDIASIYDIVYDSLITIDDNYRPVGDLAESWEATNGGKTWTFTLRNDVTFSDGTLLTANDVVATTKYILDKVGQEQVEGEEPVDKGYYQNLQYFVSSVTAADEKTVVFKTKRSYYGFLYALNYPILPADKLDMDNPPGTGAYVIRTFEAQDYMWLQANDQWWQTQPLIQNINVIFHRNNKDLITSYEYSRVDAVFTRAVSASQYKTGVSSVSLDYRTRELELLMINNTEQALQSVNVRKAVRHAINVDLIISSVYLGMGDRADTPIVPNIWLAKEYEAENTYDPEKAIALLEEEGWFDMDGDGVRERTAGEKQQRLHIKLCVYEEPDNDVRVPAAMMIQDMLEDVGFEIEFSTTNYDDMKSKLKNRSYNLAFVSVNMDPVQDPGFLLMTNNTMNYYKYSNKELDTLFTQLRSSTKAEDYQETLHQIQDIYTQDLPFISLFYRKGVVVSRKMYTLARQIREMELLRGIDTYGR